MSAADTLPDAVRNMIDTPLYEERTEFPIEIGYVYNTCAAVENGNPLYWDEELARTLVGKRIAPPTMLSVWFRPHYWAPGASGERKALQAHFDLKELLGITGGLLFDGKGHLYLGTRFEELLVDRHMDSLSLAAKKVALVIFISLYDKDVDKQDQRGRAKWRCRS